MVTGREAFRRRLDRLDERLTPAAPRSWPENDWLESLTDEQRAAEEARDREILAGATADQLAELTQSFTIHPSKRGPTILWPRPPLKS